MKKTIICLLCVVMLCGCAQKATDNQKISVVTTIFPLYDFARAIGEDKLDIKMLIRPGSEVHSYDPLPSDMAAVYDSDLFLYIGGESDTWVNTVIDGESINALPLIECVSHSAAEHSHGGHSHTDEHIWTAPDNAVKMLDAICEQLISVDAQNADFYRKNRDIYVNKIKTASTEIANTVSQFENPFIVVADRFPFFYFTSQYGIDYEAAFGGCAVSTDISLKTMARLTDTIKKRQIQTVFCTEISNKNIANALKDALGLEVVELHSAHNVTLDDFKSGVTYVDLMYRNLNALKRGLS